MIHLMEGAARDKLSNPRASCMPTLRNLASWTYVLVVFHCQEVSERCNILTFLSQRLAGLLEKSSVLAPRACRGLDVHRIDGREVL